MGRFYLRLPVEINLVSKNESVYIFQLDKNNYIKFCPERGGLITNWVSDEKEILYFEEEILYGVPQIYHGMGFRRKWTGRYKTEHK